MTTLFGSEAVSHLALRLALDLACVGLLVRGVYLTYRPSREFAFTHVMLNLVTFSLAYLMNRVPMDIGFGLGLFAIFGILRYRTQALRIADLTYLFVAIGLAVINGIDHASISLGEVLLLDMVAIGMPALLEWSGARDGGRTVTLLYDRIDLLTESRTADLHADLQRRLGVVCSEVRVGPIDLLRDTVELTVVVHEPRRAA
ncbi:MAG: DUF4956 domain-containing protein [Deltaproteobacteria bacterium]|nr:MAG: DUF4956 domain-containing protein [Deltaproteobacteria bacterium]